MDILKSDNSLKKMPYSVPERYFSELAGRTAMRSMNKHVQQRTIIQILAPYTAMAAMFAMIVIAGKSVLKLSDTPDSQIRNEEFYYSEILPLNWDSEELYESQDYDYIAENNATDRDIIEYLIQSGISIEEISIEYE